MSRVNRSIILRLATFVVFAIVAGLYLQRPDQGTIIGVLGTALVWLGVMWSPRRDLAAWQIVLVLVGLPVALAFKMNHDSSAKDLVGRVIFLDSVLASLAIIAAAAAFVIALSLLPRTERRRVTPF